MNDKNCETTHAHKDDTTRGQQQMMKTSSPLKPIQNRGTTTRPSTHKQRSTRLRRGSPHNRSIKGFYKTTLQTRPHRVSPHNRRIKGLYKTTLQTRLHRVSPHNRRIKGFYKVTLQTTTQARNKSTHRGNIAPWRTHRRGHQHNQDQSCLTPNPSNSSTPTTGIQQ